MCLFASKILHSLLNFHYRYVKDDMKYRNYFQSLQEVKLSFTSGNRCCEIKKSLRDQTTALQFVEMTCYIGQSARNLFVLQNYSFEISKMNESGILLKITKGNILKTKT